MKKIIIVIVCILSTCLCFGQDRHGERSIQRIDNKLYIVENGTKYEIDQTRVLGKLKPQRELPKNLCKESRELGFGIIEITVPQSMAVEDYLSAIERTDDFEFVEYNTYGEYLFTPNDSLVGNATGQQWYLDRINAYDAWDITTGNPTIKVAVLDSGVDSCHYDLGYGLDNYTHLAISDGYNYPHNTTYYPPTINHGTMVAGIIGAKTNNNRGIAGIAGGNNSAGITIIPYNIGESTPVASYLISAINDAVQKGAKIINLSLAVSESSSIDYVINAAYNQGMTIVCATGNGGVPPLKYPASNPYTIAVGATNQSNERAFFSTYGDGIDLVAPGTSMISTSLNNGYDSSYGDSFSAPQVSGVVALMLSANPSLAPSQIQSILQSTCTQLSGYSYNSSGWNSEVGYGLLNAFSAVYHSKTHSVAGPSEIYNTNGTYYINNLPNGVTVEWSLSDSYYNQNCLQQNYPSQNRCTITCSSVQDMSNAVLTATIKHNGTVVETLTRNVSAYIGFRGTYSSSVGSGAYTVPNPIFTALNTIAKIIAPRLVGATITFTGDATPSYWLHNNNTLDVKMPTTGSTIVVNVHCSNGDNYYIPIIKYTNPYYLSVTFGGDVLSITQDESAYKEQSWSIEVYSTMTGEKVVAKDVIGNSVSLNTAGWKRGLYVVRATVGKEVMTEKIQVR